MYRDHGDLRIVSLYIYIDNKSMTDAAGDFSENGKAPQNSEAVAFNANANQYTPSPLERQTLSSLSSDTSAFSPYSSYSSNLSRGLYSSSSFSDVSAYSRMGGRNIVSGARLPDLQIASADFGPEPQVNRAVPEPTLQELTNRRPVSGLNERPNTRYDALLPQVTLSPQEQTVIQNQNQIQTGSSLDRLSRGALNYIENNGEQLRRSVVRGPYEAANANAQRYLPNVSIGPAASSYAFETPQGNWQQMNGGFQGCPCPNCASGAYRPENGPRPYQQQPWTQGYSPYGQDFSGYNPNARFDPNPAQQFDPRAQQYDPRAQFDPRFGNPNARFDGRQRVTPDLLPPGWFEEIYENAPPRTPDRPVRPNDRPPGYVPPGNGRYPPGAINRSQFDRELQDPNVMAAFAGRMHTEVGSQGPAAQLAWAETVMNRAASRNQTLLQALTGRYYPTHSPGRSSRQDLIQAITRAWREGTDTTQGSTGNASGSVGFGRGGREIIRINGEKFGMEEVDLRRGWLQKYQQLKTGDRGPGNPQERPQGPQGPGAELPNGPMTADQIRPDSVRRYPGRIPEADRQRLMQMALIRCGLPTTPQYINGLRIIIEKESSWDPNVVNRWDSNWRRGTPSMGLIQTIEPTFRRHRMEGYEDILNPLHNMIAGIRYAVHRYGDLLNVPGLRSMRAGGAYRGY